MTTLYVRDASGTQHRVDCKDGLSIMEALRPLNFGIGGDCEGSIACATCHVWVDEPWIASTGEPSEEEASMLDCIFQVRPTSRLSCQISVSPELDGLCLSVPT
jgi:2Fe-2S ferredoxin